MNEARLKAAAAEWLALGCDALVVSVERSQGSVPRGEGTRMVVGRDAVLGTLGGGHLELKAIERARALMSETAQDPGDDGFAPVIDRYTLGPSLGQCCGGAVVLRTERLSARVLRQWEAAEPRFVLWLHGAGHVGRAIVRLLLDINCRVRWIDEREQEWAVVEREMPELALAAHIERVCPENAVDEVAGAPPDAMHLVMTHRHDLDLQLAAAVLRRGDFADLGVIGSATKAARFRSRLADRYGIELASIVTMRCPIGLPGIHGKEPAVIAVSVVAALLHHSKATAHLERA